MCRVLGWGREEMRAAGRGISGCCEYSGWADWGIGEGSRAHAPTTEWHCRSPSSLLSWCPELLTSPGLLLSLGKPRVSEFVAKGPQMTHCFPFSIHYTSVLFPLFSQFCYMEYMLFDIICSRDLKGL